MRTSYLLLTALVALFVFACTQRRSGESTVDEQRLTNGKAVYDAQCAVCHMADGNGTAPMNPPLIRTSFVLGDEKELISIVLNGMSGIEVDGQTYKNVMPSFAFLSDDEIADVLTYVRTSFGNDAGAVHASAVTEVRGR